MSTKGKTKYVNFTKIRQSVKKFSKSWFRTGLGEKVLPCAPISISVMLMQELCYDEAASKGS